MKPTTSLFTGTVLIADTESVHSGVTYPLHEVERALEQFKARVETNTVWGTFAPENRSIPPSMDDATHMVVDSWLDGNEWKATIKVLDSPQGKLLESMIKSGTTFRFAPVARGRLDMDTRLVEKYTIDSIELSEVTND